MAGSPFSPPQQQRLLGVIIPAYNEEPFVEHVIRQVLREPSVEQVVVVDDCSSDGTLAAANRCTGDPRVTVKHHETNLGKGAAIRTGLEAIAAPLVVIQDADLEYDPADYDKLISPIVRGRADVVYGIRGFAGQSAYSYWFVVGNRLVTTATNILFNCYIQDMETGFKVMRTSLMRRLGLRGNRFDVEPEITGRILRLGYRIYEVPIEYAARTRAQGKKLTWLDGVKAVFVLLRIRLTTSQELFGKRDPYHEERLTKLSLPAFRFGVAEETRESRGTPVD
ncbi:MAG: glycosyltransferase family 2 protein [Candidatus Dormibacteraeota bacterium]|nr:glycosyltransferase family 2 protein [Candidatus Dormibacteraeota bacterium]